MDVERPDLARKAKFKKRLYAGLGVSVLSVLLVFLFLYNPGPPQVKKETIWPATVERGSMLRQVMGVGSLVPNEIRWVSARTSGRIERIFVLPGTLVEPDTILMELSNPDIVQQTQNADLQLRAEEANFTSFEVQLRSDLLQMESTLAQLEADLKTADLRAGIDEELYKEGIESELTMKLSRLRADQLKVRYEKEQQRLAYRQESFDRQISARQAQVDQSRARYELLKGQMDGLKVRAGVSGVLQRQTVEEGQQVNPGASLAQVTNPLNLKAVIRVSELQAKEVERGQFAEISTYGDDTVPGVVSRVDPNVDQGTVTVDIELTGALPDGARPDLTVQGYIEIENLEDIIYVTRPNYVRPNSSSGVFKFIQDSDIAERSIVEFGRTSVNTIEVVSGLVPGDRIIISDTSDWEQFDQIRIN